LAQGSTCRRCVTRALNGATPWFHEQYGQSGTLAVKDGLIAQPAVLIGLIAHIVGTPLWSTDIMPISGTPAHWLPPLATNPRFAAQGRFRTFQIYPKDLAPPQVNNPLTQKS
jgi:hypothetical protein